MIGKISRKVVIFVVYVQPTLRAAELEELKEALSVEVGAARRSYKDPLILVSGDFNHRDVGAALNEVGDFDAVSTGPTRGNSTSDLVYTNALSAQTDTRVLPPLESLGGTILRLSFHLNETTVGLPSGGELGMRQGRRLLRKTC